MTMLICPENFLRLDMYASVVLDGKPHGTAQDFARGGLGDVHDDGRLVEDVDEIVVVRMKVDSLRICSHPMHAVLS